MHGLIYFLILSPLPISVPCDFNSNGVSLALESLHGSSFILITALVVKKAVCLVVSSAVFVVGWRCSDAGCDSAVVTGGDVGDFEDDFEDDLD